jgi:peptidoglycan-associated lipoprotein
MKHFNKLTLTAIAVICMVISVNAQKKLEQADLAFQNRQYYNAVELYKQAYTQVKKAETKAKVLYRTAYAYQEINDLKSAETYYQKAIAAKYPDPEAVVRLADVLKAQMKYPEAITEYKNFKQLNPSDPRGDKGVKSCELAQQWKDNPARYKLENMALINSKESDFSPNYSDKKYNTLIFTSTREGVANKMDITTGQNYSTLYETKLDKNGKWSTPVPLPATVNNPEVNTGAAAVSKKGDFMLLTICPQVKQKISGCQLYIAKKQGSGWAAPEKLPFNKDSVQFGHPALSPDGKTVYFVSRMQGGMGGADIWKTTFDQKANTWGSPVNLGASINTGGDDMYPYVSDDGKFLYFSSNGHPGMGGLDLFKAEIGTGGKFAKAPENLKYPMNSGGDDFGIVFERNKQRGYLSSNREGGKGNDDIWSFYLPPLVFNLKGQVVSKGGNNNAKGKGEPVSNAKLKIVGSDGTINESNTGNDGNYTFKLKENVSYTVNIETSKQTASPSFKTDGYLASTDKGVLTTAGVPESKDFVKNFEVTPVEKAIRMPEIQYDLGKWDLRADMRDSMLFLYNVMKENPSIVVELNSHTDSRDNDKKNLELSQKRAQSCVDFLVNEKGIPSARLKAVGKGETELLVTDAVIKKAKTKEEKEALHQKNRRTTFKILSWDYRDPNAPKDQPKTPTKPKEEEEEEGE